MSEFLILPISHEDVIIAANEASEVAGHSGYNENDYNDAFIAGAEWCLNQLTNQSNKHEKD